MAAAITIDGISKCYQIGLRPEQYKTLRDTIVEAFKSPFRRLAGMGGDGPDRR